MRPASFEWPQAGFARADITPERALPLAGYGFRTALAARIESPLEANALLTGTGGVPLLIVCIDALFGSDAMRHALAARLSDACPGLTAERIHLIASHTHYAPSLDASRPRLGACDAAHVAEVVERLVTAIEHVEPVRIEQMAQGQAHCTENVYRRRRTWVRDPRSVRFRRQTVTAPAPQVAVNTRLDIAQLRSAQGDVLAILWSWPCHPVSHGQAAVVSSDFPGEIRARLRKRHGDALSVFYLPGFCGDVRPRIVARRWRLKEVLAMPFVRPFIAPDASDRAHLFEAIATAGLSADTLASASARRVTGPAAEPSVTRLPLDELLEVVAGEALPTGHLESTVLHLAPLRVCLLNAEVSGAYVDSASACDFASGCANDVFGYLPTDVQITEGGYEVTGFRPLFELRGRYTGPVEARVRTCIDPG